MVGDFSRDAEVLYRLNLKRLCGEHSQIDRWLLKLEKQKPCNNISLQWNGK